jgi:hypothetical protein
MMHRNVIFKNAAVPGTVFSAFEGTGEDLHRWLEENCTEPARLLGVEAGGGEEELLGLPRAKLPRVRVVLDAASSSAASRASPGAEPPGVASSSSVNPGRGTCHPPPPSIPTT